MTQGTSVFAAAIEAEEELLFSHAGLTISEEEVFFYLRDRLAPQAYQSALEKPSVISDALTNFYVLKRGAALAIERGLADEAELRFAAAEGPRRLAVKRLLQAESQSRVEATDWAALAEERYILEVARYEGRDEVNVDHILIKTDGRSFNDLVARVDEVRSALDASDSFSEVAKAYSEDRSAELNGGALGYLGRDDLDPAFAEAAFAMTEPGSLSEPVLSSFGVHLIRFNARRMSEPVSFEAAKPRLIEALKSERRSAVKGEVLAPYWTEPAEAIQAFDQEALRLRLKSRFAALPS
jgi:parvulin-like peptidyl-prolyl isomerase